MPKAITFKDILVPKAVKQWDDYKKCCRQVRLSRISYVASEVFKGILAAGLVIGGGLLMAFLSTSTFVFLPISLSFIGAGVVALIISIAFRCLSERHIKGYKPKDVVEVASEKFLDLLDKRSTDLKGDALKEANKKLRKKTNLAVPSDHGIISKYNWFKYPDKLDGEFSIRTLQMSKDRIIDLLESAFEKDILLHLYKFPHYAQGIYPPKQKGKDPYKEACLEADEYAAEFAARILHNDPNASIIKLSAQIDLLRQTCREDKKIRCPFIFEIKEDPTGIGTHVILRKRDFPELDIDKYKKIFTSQGLQVVEVDEIVKPN